MKELILDQISDNFNPKKHIPITPGCFLGKEEIFPEFEDLEYLRVIENNDDLIYLDKLTSNEALSLVSTVAQKYNKDIYHKYPQQFWKTIYFPFLGLLIPWLYRKQILVKKYLEKYADKNLKVTLIETETFFKYDDEKHLIFSGFWNPDINAWLFSQILSLQIPKIWIIKKKQIELKIGKASDNDIRERSIRDIIADLFFKTFNRSSKVYGFSIIDTIYFHFLLYFKNVAKTTYRIPREYSADRINWDFNIESMIDIFLPETLRNLNIPQYRFKNSRLSNITNYSNRLYYNIDSKISAAIDYLKSNIVIATQHGGHSYGSGLTYEYIKNIEFDADYFIAWGSYQVSGLKKNNIISMPSPLLSKLYNKHNNKSNKVIMVGTQLVCFPIRLDPSINEVSVLAYRKNKSEFVNNLLIDELWYRPYFKRSTDYRDWEYLRKYSKNVKILEGNLHEELRKCRLLILDHPGTTWNISMAMNVPIILYWERNHFPFNIEANQFLDKLKDLGLYFEEPIQAAKKVNQIINNYDDLSDWWNQKDIQQIRKEWMNHFAMADKKWFSIWTKTLWNLKK